LDKYLNFQHMKQCERGGVDYRLRWRIGSTGIAILCIHGGDIEPGTSQIADETAGADHAFYALEGLKKSGNTTLHITSTVYDEPIALDIICQSEIIISIHGCSEIDDVVHLGGLDMELKKRIQEKLDEAGFRALDGACSKFRGIDQRNICNLCGRGMGVQLEISKGLRRRMFKDLTPEGRQYPTEAFYSFVQAIRDALDPFKRPVEEWPESCGSGVFSRVEAIKS